MSAPAWLVRSRLLWPIMLRTRLTAPSRQLPVQMTMCGWRSRVTTRGIKLTCGDRDIWARHEDIYHLLARFDNIARRVTYKAHSDRWIADLRGEAQYLVPQTGDRIWQNEIVEGHEMRGYFARGEPALGDLVFDVGAYSGEFSLIASRIVGRRGRVIAFEPDIRNRARLECNLREAGVSNVTVCPAGLWRETTELGFATRGICDSCIPAASGRFSANTTVPVCSLRDAAARFGPPDFVKMDIEGAEIEVIEGAAEWLRDRRLRLAIASYHRRNGRPSSVQVEARLRAAAYTVETGFPAHPTTWASHP